MEKSKQGEFLPTEIPLFEVGGHKKTFDQIKDIPDSFLAVDDIETGRRNRIPLYMFGMFCIKVFLKRNTL